MNKLKRLARAAALFPAIATPSYALTYYVDAGSPWPAGWYNAAVANMKTTVDMYNAYGDFGNGSIYVYYNAGIPTAQSGYGAAGGSIGDGGTYPNVRVLLHESSHWLGTGTYSANWTGPAANALIQQFDGVGAVMNGDSQHYWPYGENYDSESSAINDRRHVAIVYALRKDFGIGSTARPSSATSVVLNGSDALGDSGFNTPWQWSDAHFAQPGTTYSTGANALRTPTGYPSWSFVGDSLTVNAGGSVLFNGYGTTGVVTFKKLIVDGGTIKHDQFAQDLFQLGGKITLASTSTINAANGAIKVLAPIDGAGSLNKTGNFSLTLTAPNTYAGNTVISGGVLRLAPASPIASYTFDNVSGATVVNDGTGGATMNGTLASGAAIASGGQTGNAVSLSGGASVNINNPITDMGNSSAWTVSAWVKTTTAGSTILSKSDGTTWAQGNTILYLGDGTAGGSGGIPSGVRYGGGFMQGSTGAKSVADGTWHQVTYVSNAGDSSLYVDGAVQPLSAGNSAFANGDIGSIIRLGATTNTFAGDGTVNFNGLMDNVRFYGQALSASQVGSLYQGKDLFGSLPTTSNVSIASGGSLDLNGATQQIGSLSGVAGSSVALGSGRLMVNSAAPSTFAGSISGAGGSIVKQGAGTLTLSGANTFTGSTTIEAGTLQLSKVAGTSVANTAIASYSFDSITGTTVNNGGLGGTAMNGTIAGGATVVAGGHSGNAISLANGASVNISNGITNLGSAGDWTVTSWVKTTTAGGSIVTKSDGAWANGNTIFYLGDGAAGGSGGIPSSVRYAGGFFQGSAAAASVTDGLWHQVSYVNNGGTYAIYVDGVIQPLSVGNSAFSNADVGGTVRIGASTNTVASDGTLNFRGLLDDVQFYGQALSADQIAALYSGLNVGPLPRTTDLSIASGATLDVNGVVQQVSSLTGAAGASVLLGDGQLIVGGATNTQFAGAISGTGALIKQGIGTLTLTGTNTFTGPTTVTAGTVTLGASRALSTSPIAISAGSLTIAPGQTTAVVVSALAIASPGKADIGNSGLVLDYTAGDSTAAGNAVAEIVAGRITSSLLAGNANLAVGYASAGDLGGTFQNVTLDPSSLAILATFKGDANLDKSVNFDDLLALAKNYNIATGASWAQGDSNYDGAVNFDDLLALAKNYNQTLPASSEFSAAFAADWSLARSLVPEPASMLTLGVVGAALARRRRR